MKTKILTYVLFLFFMSCTPDFNTPRYRSKVHKHWHRKQVIIFKQDVYRNPIVRKEAKFKLLNPPSLNLDKW